MTDLVDRFQQMGLANFLQHRCDWNETVIRQFYATFAQFAEANKLDYNFITSEQSVNVVLENPLDENDYPMFYEPAHLGIARSFGALRV